jgi:hypothetical protein
MRIISDLLLSILELIREPGGILVLIGVAGECIFDWTNWPKNEEQRKKLKRTFGLLLILGLAIELPESAKLRKLASDATLQVEQLKQINLGMAKLVEDLRAKNLNLEKQIVEIILDKTELEEYANDRTLFDKSGVADRLNKFAGVAVTIAAVTNGESRQLADQIRLVLRRAHWKVSPETIEMAIPSLTSQKGIMVQSFTEPYGTAAIALVGELNKSHMVANWHGVPVGQEPKFTPSSNVEVFVLSKPTPYEAKQLKLEAKMEELLQGGLSTGPDFREKWEKFGTLRDAKWRRFLDEYGPSTNKPNETNAVR